jgi:hypothetical protein
MPTKLSCEEINNCFNFLAQGNFEIIFSIIDKDVPYKIKNQNGVIDKGAIFNHLVSIINHNAFSSTSVAESARSAPILHTQDQKIKMQRMENLHKFFNVNQDNALNYHIVMYFLKTDEKSLYRTVDEENYTILMEIVNRSSFTEIDSYNIIQKLAAPN